MSSSQFILILRTVQFLRRDQSNIHAAFAIKKKNVSTRSYPRDSGNSMKSYDNNASYVLYCRHVVLKTIIYGVIYTYIIYIHIYHKRPKRLAASSSFDNAYRVIKESIYRKHGTKNMCKFIILLEIKKS